MTGDTDGYSPGGLLHTHPPTGRGASLNFSNLDYRFVREYKMPIYLRNEIGDVRVIRGAGTEFGGVKGQSICSNSNSCLSPHPNSTVLAY